MRRSNVARRHLFDYLRNLRHKNRRNKFYVGCFLDKYYYEQGLCAVENARAEVFALSEKSQVLKKAWDFLILGFRFWIPIYRSLKLRANIQLFISL